MTETMTKLQVHAIPPAKLATIRDSGTDGHGTAVLPYPAEGGEPLRCCLTRARPGEEIALISYAPFDKPSPWREVGPVYIHPRECAGHPGDELPPDLRGGPRILRTYDADDALDYEHITLVPEGEDIEPALRRLFEVPEVATVHVRTLMPQCFLFAVTR
jgi:Protein of unknown function (DUF1203)